MRAGVIAAISGIAIIVIAGSVAFFAPEMVQRPLNGYFPKADRTLAISQVEMRKAGGYAFKIGLERGGEKIGAAGSMDEAGNYEASVTMRHPIASSTVSQESPLEFEVMKSEGAMYIQDPYDGTFHLPPAGVFGDKQLSFLKLELSEIINRLLTEKKNLGMSVGSEGFTLSLSSDDFANPYFPELKKAKVAVIIDKDTYLVKSLDVEWGGNDAVVAKFSETLEKPASPIAIRKPEKINPFGDLLARESVYLRTDREGAHDGLWLDWEKDHFGCERCANKYWDSDGDGLMNMKEFVFNTDPKVTDSDGDGTNDYKELFGKSNPTNSGKLSLNYSEAVDYLLNGGEPAPDTGRMSDNFVKKAFVRDSYTGFDGIVIPKDAKSLVVSFVLEGNERGDVYSTFFFDDALILKVSPISGHRVTEPFDKKYIRTESIPIAQFAGKTVRFVHILNSFGRPGGRFVMFLDGSEGILGSYIETASGQKVPLVKTKARVQKEVADLFIKALVQALVPASHAISLNKQWELGKSYSEPKSGSSFQLPSEFVLEPSSVSREFVFKTNAPQKGVWQVVVKFEGSDKDPIDAETYMEYLKTQKTRQIGYQSLKAPWLSSKPDTTIAGRQVKSLMSSVGDYKQLAAESVIGVGPTTVMHVMVIGFDTLDKVSSGGVGYSDAWFANLKDLNDLIVSSIKN